MHQNEDIFAQLRDLETPPPPELKALVDAAYANNMAANTPAGDFPGIAGLADFPVEPPLVITTGILQQYSLAVNKKPTRKTWSKTIMAVAASVLLCILVLYWVYHYNALPGNKMANSHSPVNTPDSLTITSQEVPMPKATPQQQVIIHGPVPNHHNFSINGTYGAMVNNDLWFSILMFQGEPKTHPFLFNEISGNKITIDNFTTIRISPFLAKTINESRATKKNGKPTIKARWTKRKLEKLKKQEADFFKVSSNKNPLNPVHLSNFMEQ